MAFRSTLWIVEVPYHRSESELVLVFHLRLFSFSSLFFQLYYHKVFDLSGHLITYYINILCLTCCSIFSFSLKGMKNVNIVWMALLNTLDKLVGLGFLLDMNQGFTMQHVCNIYYILLWSHLYGISFLSILFNMFVAFHILFCEREWENFHFLEKYFIKFNYIFKFINHTQERKK